MGISFIYGNIFTIMKIGANSKRWVNFSLIDALSPFYYNTGIVPNEILDWIAKLGYVHKIKGGQHLLKISREV